MTDSQIAKTIASFPVAVRPKVLIFIDKDSRRLSRLFSVNEKRTLVRRVKGIK